jgi:hypothetical protein
MIILTQALRYAIFVLGTARHDSKESSTMSKPLYSTKSWQCFSGEADGQEPLIVFVNVRLRAVRYLPRKGRGAAVLALLAAVADRPRLLNTALCNAYWGAFEPEAA